MKQITEDLEKYFERLEKYIADFSSRQTDNTKWSWNKRKDYHNWISSDKTEPDEKLSILYPELNDSRYIGQLFLDEETNELVLKIKDGKKIIIKSLEDFKKIKTKFLLKK